MSTWFSDALTMVDKVASPDGPVVLVASSMGGWISSYIASIRPERVAGLLLLGEQIIYTFAQLHRIIVCLLQGPDSNIPHCLMNKPYKMEPCQMNICKDCRVERNLNMIHLTDSAFGPWNT